MNAKRLGQYLLSAAILSAVLAAVLAAASGLSRPIDSFQAADIGNQRRRRGGNAEVG